LPIYTNTTLPKLKRTEKETPPPPPAHKEWDSKNGKKEALSQYLLSLFDEKRHEKKKNAIAGECFIYTIAKEIFCFF
jgi:hypothetical protein